MMKPIMESWRKFLKEDEEKERDCSEYLWHGSRAHFSGPVEPRQAKDLSGNPEQNLNAIYATENKDMATYIGLVDKDEEGNIDIFSDHENNKLVLIRGRRRKGEKAYLYKVPKKWTDDDGKSHEFRNTGVPDQNPEWVSEVKVEPCEIETINVDDYLDLVRDPTEEDIAFWNKHAPDDKKVEQ